MSHSCSPSVGYTEWKSRSESPALLIIFPVIPIVMILPILGLIPRLLLRDCYLHFGIPNLIIAFFTSWMVAFLQIFPAFAKFMLVWYGMESSVICIALRTVNYWVMRSAEFGYLHCSRAKSSIPQFEDWRKCCPWHEGLFASSHSHSSGWHSLWWRQPSSAGFPSS